MARTNTYTCKTCGTKFEFCLKCQFTRPEYDAENFCSKEHDRVYSILSKHGCNLISADEALTELIKYNINEIALTEDIFSHVEKIKSEVKDTPIVEEKVIIEETPIEEVSVFKSNKKNKKKW